MHPFGSRREKKKPAIGPFLVRLPHSFTFFFVFFILDDSNAFCFFLLLFSWSRNVYLSCLSVITTFHSEYLRAFETLFSAEERVFNTKRGSGGIAIVYFDRLTLNFPIGDYVQGAQLGS